MPENHISYQEKLLLLRQEIENQGLLGFIVPHTDEFQGENIAPYAERLAWLTGFTGSAGVAMILNDSAVVMSDGRYTLQLRQQVDKTLYALENSMDMPLGEWIAREVQKRSCTDPRIGYDPWLHTIKQIEVLEKQAKEIKFIPVSRNLVDVVWTDQPSRPNGEISLFSDAVAGCTSAQKRMMMADKLRAMGVDCFIITQADNLCWILNVRGQDVDYAPLMHGFGILHIDGTLDWFIANRKVTDTVKAHLGQGVRVHEIETIETSLKNLAGRTVGLDMAASAVWFAQVLDGAGVQMTDMKDPCTLQKSLKTRAEQDAMKQAHILDGVAILKFLKWFEENVRQADLTEISVAQRLDQFRAEHEHYRGESFATIAGFAENGAIIHYRAGLHANKQVCGDGLLLLDSGGQYVDLGTTDITRTLCVGTPSQEMKVNYTRVLKGHIALSRAEFPEGTIGAQVDTYARQFLWEAGLDYAHGTGHGVGCYLCVHEEAASISPRGTAPLRAGMILSNEPGFYKEGAYGIRIENLVLVVEKGISFETNKRILGFETLALVPYDPVLIEFSLLSDKERDWIKAYYMEIFNTLKAYASEDLLVWFSKTYVTQWA